MELNNIKKFADSIRENVEKVIIGKSEVIDILITCIIAEGHVLLEDVPGTGKTMIAKSLAKSMGAAFKRVQFTPDLLPSDLTGINYYNQKQGEFVFREGPLFTNILLADEINRATPRTQSSLLECMDERQISIDGVTHRLEKPFLVLATQNPIEIMGTFPLPEAQLDRFLVKINMGYPSHEEAKSIMERFINNNPLEQLSSVCSINEILEAQTAYHNIFVSDAVQKYMLDIVYKTHENEQVKLGVSPRGMLALLRACQAYAALKGREFVTPDDVRTLVKYVLPHRLIIKDSARVKGISANKILETILEHVEAPTESWDSN